LAPAFSYAFQPIVDTLAREIFSYEALIRGPANEAAGRRQLQIPVATIILAGLEPSSLVHHHAV
jgi:EAL domain-containing protein (putative c-di-GMP-specific phosphodiesterase class I)